MKITITKEKKERLFHGCVNLQKFNMEFSDENNGEEKFFACVDSIYHAFVDWWNLFEDENLKIKLPKLAFDNDKFSSVLDENSAQKIIEKIKADARFAWSPTMGKTNVLL